MLDKMEPDRIFLLMVRLMEPASVDLIASSLQYWLGVGMALLTHTHETLGRAVCCVPLT